MCQKERQADPILSGLWMSGKIGKNMLRIVQSKPGEGGRERATYEDAMMVELRGGWGGSQGWD